MSQAVAKEPEPDCASVHSKRGGNPNEWETATVTERLLVWHDPCGKCFPDGEVDVETVVKKKRRGSTPPALHRLESST